jgi:hypothetical protein
MKNYVLLLASALAFTQVTKAQLSTTVACDLMGWVLNVTDTNIVDIYHSGHYLTHPQEHNVIDWKVTDTQGNIIAQETVIDYNRFNFQPNIPLTDTLNVSAHLINDSAFYQENLVNCLLQDQLYWKEDYYTTGTLYGQWAFVHENLGVDQNSVLGINDVTVTKKPSLIKIVDILGVETKFKPNTILFYIYNDGSVEKKYVSR